MQAAQPTPQTGQAYLSEPVSFRTKSNKSPSAYPAQRLDPALFIFSTRKEIHLYVCDAHPEGIGVAK